MLYVVSGYNSKVTSRFKYRYHIIILSLCLCQVSDEIKNRTFYPLTVHYITYNEQINQFLTVTKTKTKKEKKKKKKNTILNTKQKTYIRDQKRFVLNDDEGKLLTMMYII